MTESTVFQVNWFVFGAYFFGIPAYCPYRVNNGKQYGKLCHILNQNFRVVQNNGETCTIAGECLISTDADVEHDIQTLMHYTYIWQMIEKQIVACVLFM